MILFPKIFYLGDKVNLTYPVVTCLLQIDSPKPRISMLEFVTVSSRNMMVWNWSNVHYKVCLCSDSAYMRKSTCTRAFTEAF